jgi:hypothetical protein
MTRPARADRRRRPATKKVDDPAVYARWRSLSADIVQQVQTYGAIRKVPAAADAEPAQRHVPGRRRRAPAGQIQDLLSSRRGQDAQDLPGRLEAAPASSRLGEGDGRHRARPWHHGRLEADRGHGRREDRQDPPDLRPGRGGRAGGGLTIGAAELYGLPVSTTHILSSGVAGTMAANGSGLQWSTSAASPLAWVLTLPAAIALAGGPSTSSCATW